MFFNSHFTLWYDVSHMLWFSYWPKIYSLTLFIFYGLCIKLRLNDWSPATLIRLRSVSRAVILSSVYITKGGRDGWFFLPFAPSLIKIHLSRPPKRRGHVRISLPNNILWHFLPNLHNIQWLHCVFSPMLENLVDCNSTSFEVVGPTLNGWCRNGAWARWWRPRTRPISRDPKQTKCTLLQKCTVLFKVISSYKSVRLS